MPRPLCAWREDGSQPGLAHFKLGKAVRYRYGDLIAFVEPGERRVRCWGDSCRKELHLHLPPTPSLEGLPGGARAGEL